MKERPIIFSPEMIRAILDGRKTMTRRIIKLPADACDVQYWDTPSGRPQEGYANPGINYWTPSGNHIDPCPYGYPGDRLWVRETYCEDCGVYVCYRATDTGCDNYNWYPSMLHPRRFSRILLEIEEVRAERLQDINEYDAQDEGVEGINTKWLPTYIANFSKLWNSLNAKRGYGWDANPWVWAIRFKVLEPAPGPKE